MYIVLCNGFIQFLHTFNFNFKRKRSFSCLWICRRKEKNNNKRPFFLTRQIYHQYSSQSDHYYQLIVHRKSSFITLYSNSVSSRFSSGLLLSFLSRQKKSIVFIIYWQFSGNVHFLSFSVICQIFNNRFVIINLLIR